MIILIITIQKFEKELKNLKSTGSASLERDLTQNNQEVEALQEEMKQLKSKLENASKRESELLQQIEVLNQEKSISLQEKASLTNV